MTSKLTRLDQVAPRDEMFPEFPPRGDMQNFLCLNRTGLPGAIERHFGISNSTVILGEAPLRWNPSQQRGHRIPDLMVAFDVDRDRAVKQMGYSIREQGKPPDFVLEIASVSTGFQDYTGKRTDYTAFGVPEYWRFDPSGGQFHDVHLAGDRLVDGEYQPIEIVQLDETHYYGRSDVLGLDLCWEEGLLRWWNPAKERYLSTFNEEADGRIAAESDRDAAQVERDAERGVRIALESGLDDERRARLAAENRVRELEAELERRQQP